MSQEMLLRYGMNPHQKPAAAVKIAEILTYLTQKHQIDPARLVILSNITKDHNHSIFQGQNQIAGLTFTQNPQEAKRNPKSILYQTIQKVKGLEYDGVILVLYPKTFLTPEMRYVGYTRAKHLLYVVNVG